MAFLEIFELWDRLDSNTEVSTPPSPPPLYTIHAQTHKGEDGGDTLPLTGVWMHLNRWVTNTR